MKRQPPICHRMKSWVCGRVGNRAAFAPCTGQDYRAIAVFVHALDLYANADDPGRMYAREAMRQSVLAMQPSVRHLAKSAIPFVLDWSDESRIWAELCI